jgi:DUF4097 and DUF4098 domain-containing protein YvlB
MNLMVLAVAMSLLFVPQQRTVKLEADCSDFNFMSGDYEVAYAQQQATAPMSGVLQVHPGGNGGIRIRRGTGSSYAITACIGAGARTRADAQRAADAIRLVVDGNRVRVESPRDIDNWSVQLVVEAPRGARIAADTNNGPIGIEDVEGDITARASNGPIGLDNVSGKVDARAVNGPISVSGSRGDFEVETQNGPISVDLRGSRWDGKLNARAQNGPLTVRVPDRYQSGVEVSSEHHAPWSCRIAACRTGTRDWDDRSRSLRIGSDPVVVRISTVNGPVTIAASRQP